MFSNGSRSFLRVVVEPCVKLLERFACAMTHKETRLRAMFVSFKTRNKSKKCNGKKIQSWARKSSCLCLVSDLLLCLTSAHKHTDIRINGFWQDYFFPTSFTKSPFLCFMHSTVVQHFYLCFCSETSEVKEDKMKKWIFWEKNIWLLKPRMYSHCNWSFL